MKLSTLFENASPEWAQILSRFPKALQKEILDERPSGTDEDIKEIAQWQLESPMPVSMPVSQLLKISSNLEAISRTPPNVINSINQKWRLQVRPGKSYEKTPGRYEEYAKMSSETAGPSTMVNGEIYWGIGRFIAALLRGDKTIKVWKIALSQR